MNHIDPTRPYRGRFAPTPSGPLHMGSLIAAVASYLDARSRGGRWLLRIDDLDRPRCQPGASDRILRQLDSHALHWDEAVRFQSQRLAAYEAALARLRDMEALYACECTRATQAAIARAGPDGPVYPGRCADRRLDGTGRSLRFCAGDGRILIEDPWQGTIRREAGTDIGDFVVRRADGQIAYQLACAVDEIELSISDVVRGADLIGSTARQCLLLDALGQPRPQYRHFAVLLGPDGRKLSKQNHAPPVQETQASQNLWFALRALGQAPPPELEGTAPAALLEWARRHWQAGALPRRPDIPAGAPYNAAQQNSPARP